MIGMKIKEIIVVEGKNDSNVLKSHFDCDTIETQGTHLGKKTLAAIRLAKKSGESLYLPILTRLGIRSEMPSTRQYLTARMHSLRKARHIRQKRSV